MDTVFHHNYHLLIQLLSMWCNSILQHNRKILSDTFKIIYKGSHYPFWCANESDLIVTTCHRKYYLYMYIGIIFFSLFFIFHFSLFFIFLSLFSFFYFIFFFLEANLHTNFNFIQIFLYFRKMMIIRYFTIDQSTINSVMSGK